MAEIANINAAVDEKLRMSRHMLLEEDRALFWDTANLVWVTRDMTNLAYEAGLTMPDDFEPRRSDFGILPNHMFICFAGEEFVDNVWLVNADPANEEDVVLWGSWSAGDETLTSHTWKLNRGATLAGAYEVPDQGWSAFWAFILLANERLARIFYERPSRATRRRSNNTIDTVVVVTLRRLRAATREEESDGSITYSHRWMVQGHWRNQWYESEKRHRPRWIAPYVKGPEGKPLVMKDRIFRVSR